MRELNAIVAHLKTAIEETTLGNCKKESITADSLIMEEIGLDSLDYASIMLSGETFVSSKVNENNVNWRDVKTVGQLAELIYKCQKQ